MANAASTTPQPTGCFTIANQRSGCSRRSGFLGEQNRQAGRERAEAHTRASQRGRFHRLGIFRHVVHAEQFFLVENHLLAAAAGQIEQARQLDRIHRAGFFAHAAENATQLVDGETFRIFFPIGPRAGGRDNIDAMRRARRRTQKAGHALHAPFVILVQPMHAAINERVADLRPLLGKAHRQFRAKQMLHRRRQTLHQQRQVHAAAQTELRFFNPA